jgi:hypothetical protein
MRESVIYQELREEVSALERQESRQKEGRSPPLFTLIQYAITRLMAHWRSSELPS